MARATVSGSDQKAFVRIFDGICQWNSRWDRWNDMIKLFAIELANTVDVAHRARRNEAYAAIAKKYKPEEFKRFAELFGELVLALESNPFQDFLGSMYMELELGSDQTGQFFTPYSVCCAMAEITMQGDYNELLKREGYITINDPACGAGATLIAAAEVLHKNNINFQQQAIFIAQDIDQTVGLMCYVQMSLIGCAGYVRIGNTLTDPTTCHPLYGDGTENCWMMPMFFTKVWHTRRLVDRMKRMLTPLKPDSITSEGAAPQEIKEETATIQLGQGKNGQMMFDLGASTA